MRYQSAKEILVDLKRLQRSAASGETATKAATAVAKLRMSRRRVVGLTAATGGMTGIAALGDRRGNGNRAPGPSVGANRAPVHYG